MHIEIASGDATKCGGKAVLNEWIERPGWVNLGTAAAVMRHRLTWNGVEAAREHVLVGSNPGTRVSYKAHPMTGSR